MKTLDTNSTSPSTPDPNTPDPSTPNPNTPGTSTSNPNTPGTNSLDLESGAQKSQRHLHPGGRFTSFGAQIIYGLIIGLVLGFIAQSVPWLTTGLTAVGSAYVTLLKVLVPPLVVTAVISSIANLRKVTNAARLATQTILWFMITALISVLIGIAVGLIIRPGRFTSIDTSAAATPDSVGSWWAFLSGLLPDNIFGLQVTESTVSFSVLQLLIMSIVFGIAAVKVGDAAQPIFTLADAALQVIQKILWWIIRLAPIGTAALIGKAVASYGWEALGSLGFFVLAIYIGLALVLFLVYPIILRTNGVDVVQYFRKVWPVTSLGFVTRSSMGVMPVNQKVAEEQMGVPTTYAAFAMPLGATTKMDGCASIYPAIAAIFIAEFYQIPLSVTDYLLIVFVSVIGSAATAGTTGATVMLTLTLSTVGLPLEGVGLLLSIEPIIDMGRTAVNVTGQNVVAVVVSARERILNRAVFESSPRAEAVHS